MPRQKSTDKKSSKGKKKKIPQNEEEISEDSFDLDEIEEEENDDIGNSTHMNDHKIIDPNTPIGELTIEEILSYLINLGKENFNPKLKFGALNLLKTLKGIKPKRNYNNNHRGGYQNASGDNNYRGGYQGSNHDFRGSYSRRGNDYRNRPIYRD